MTGYHSPMTLRQPTGRVIAAALAAFLLSCLSTRIEAQSTIEQLQRAADLTYNLDHDEAVRLLRDAVARAPENTAAHRALASTLWLNLLFRRGAVTVDHYLGSFTRSSVEVPPPPPAVDAEFRKEVARAIELAEKRISAAPKDPQAHYDLGAAVGLEASYIASVEGKLLAGFRAARRSYDEQETALDLDSRRKDAGLVVGTYRYIVSTLSLPMRLVAYVAGFGGGKERGIQMLEEAAAYPGDSRTDALFALVLVYNRERRYDDALRVLDQLKRRYPRNRLLLLEAGSTALRAGRAGPADALLSDGLTMYARDNRPKVPGEAALWRYKRGAARVALGRRDEARADLNAALAPDAARWVQGRARVELAKLAIGRGDRDGAIRESRAAIDLCGQAHDPVCLDEAKKVVR